MRTEAMIFDVDGTLIDSNDAHARAWVDALEKNGITCSVDEVRKLIGMGSDKLLPRVASVEMDSQRGKKLLDDRGAIFRERYFNTIGPFAGARALLLRLKEDGVRLAVASSAQEEELGRFLEIAQVRDLIEESTSSDDAEKSKPDPDIVEAALSRLGSSREATIMVGDTPYDIEAASRARVRSIALRSGGWIDDALAGAIAIYDDTSDLLRRYDARTW